MTFLLSLGVAVLFAAGAFLMLKRNLMRVVAGVILISHAATLFLMAAGLNQGQAPVYPLEEGPVSDPLVQALALTAIVITFGVTALLLALLYRVYLSHDSLDQRDLLYEEEKDEVAMEQESGAV